MQERERGNERCKMQNIPWPFLADSSFSCFQLNKSRFDNIRLFTSAVRWAGRFHFRCKGTIVLRYLIRAFPFNFAQLTFFSIKGLCVHFNLICFFICVRIAAFITFQMRYFVYWPLSSSLAVKWDEIPLNAKYQESSYFNRNDVIRVNSAESTVCNKNAAHKPWKLPSDYSIGALHCKTKVIERLIIFIIPFAIVPLNCSVGFRSAEPASALNERIMQKLKGTRWMAAYDELVCRQCERTEKLEKVTTTLNINKSIQHCTFDNCSGFSIANNRQTISIRFSFRTHWNFRSLVFQCHHFFLRSYRIYLPLTEALCLSRPGSGSVELALFLRLLCNKTGEFYVFHIIDSTEVPLWNVTQRWS